MSMYSLRFTRLDWRLCLLTLVVLTGCQQTVAEPIKPIKEENASEQEVVAVAEASAVEISLTVELEMTPLLPTATPLPPTETPEGTTPTATSPPATPTETSTPQPTATETPLPTATFTPAPVSGLRQITTIGCCVRPFFSPDDRQILFIDKPDDVSPVGIYGVDVVEPQDVPILISDIIGFRNPDRTIVATLGAGGLVNLTNEQTGEQWQISTNGNWPNFSPDSSQIIWNASDLTGPFDKRQTDVWRADLDGSNAELLTSIYGGGFAGWFPDGQRILLTGKEIPSLTTRTLYVFDLATRERTELFTENRLRNIRLSPDGQWVAFFVSFPDEPTNSGIWVMGTDGATQRKLDLPRFGVYNWRDANTIYYIPFKGADEPSMQIWAVDVTTGNDTPLTSPDQLAFNIANGDWSISNDGRQIAFVSAADQNVWLLSLP